MANATIQNLDVNLRVKDETKKGTDSASKNIKGFSGLIKGLASGPIGAGFGAGLGFSIGKLVVDGAIKGIKALAEAIPQQIEAVSQIVDSANKIGIGTAALIGFQFAAQQASMSSEEMNGALQTLQVNVSKAANGLGKARLSIKQLGFDAAEFNKLPLQEKVNQLADALAKVENPADRVRHAVAIFGDAKILNALEGGSGAMKAMAEDARFLGLTLDNATAGGVEQAGDALGRLGASFLGVARQITALLAPAIEYAANLFANGVASIREYLLGTVDDVAEMSASLGAYLDTAGLRWEVYKDTVAYALVATYEDTKHYLSLIPDVFVAFGKAVYGVLEAIGKNIAEQLVDFYDILVTGREPIFEGMKFSLLDAWNGAWDELMKEVPRQTSDLENEILDGLNRNQAKLNEGFKKALEKRKAQNPEKPFGEVPGGGNKKQSGGGGQFGVAEKGSTEAFSIIAKAYNDRAEKQQEMIDHLANIDEATGDLRNKADEEEAADI